MNPQFRIITNNQLLSSYPRIHYDINKYYPVGLRKDDLSYNSDERLKHLNREIRENILNRQSYNENWIENVIKRLDMDFNNVKIFPTTAGFVPCFSGAIRLKESSNKRYKTELHFYKSLINGYFTVEILEIDTLMETYHPILGKKTIVGCSRIIVSPVSEYKEEFMKVFNRIQEIYEDSKFVPFLMNFLKIKHLEVPHTSDMNVSVSDALFKKYSRYNPEHTELIGNINYKLEQL